MSQRLLSFKFMHTDYPSMLSMQYVNCSSSTNPHLTHLNTKHCLLTSCYSSLRLFLLILLSPKTPSSFSHLLKSRSPVVLLSPNLTSYIRSGLVYLLKPKAIQQRIGIGLLKHRRGRSTAGRRFRFMSSSTTTSSEPCLHLTRDQVPRRHHRQVGDDQRTAALEKLEGVDLAS